ncbi:MAG: hypothetical protein ACI8RY_001738, partial [Urechidicola sp.]
MKKYILLTFLLSISLSIQSQDAFPSSMGNFSGSGGASSFTIGQVFYTSIASSAGFVSQGVQQAFEIQTLSNPDLLT